MSVCKNGHERNELNTGTTRAGKHYCRVCNKLRMRKVTQTPEGKAKNVARARAWVDDHREQYRQYCRNRRDRTNAWLHNYKQRGCTQCPETAPECLDFHHNDPAKKSFNIGVRASAMSLEKVIAEVMKCTLLCANCHRKLHARQRELQQEVA